MLSCCDGFGIVFPHHCIVRNFARNLCLKGSIAANADLRGVIDWPNIIPCIEENEKKIYVAGFLVLEMLCLRPSLLILKGIFFFVCVVQKYLSSCFNRLF